MLFGECKELRGQLAQASPLNANSRDPKAVEDREQQQRIFGGSPSASACSIKRRARSAAAFVSGAAYPLTWMSGVMSAT